MIRSVWRPQTVEMRRNQIDPHWGLETQRPEGQEAPEGAQIIPIEDGESTFNTDPGEVFRHSSTENVQAEVAAFWRHANASSLEH